MVAAFILCCLIGYYLLDSLAKILNVKNLGDQVPAEFAGIYEPDRYRESQRYLRMKTRFELVSATFDLVCLLLFWSLGGFERLDIWLRSMHQGPIVTGILYLGVLGMARELLELPFEAYATFVIEQRFGFNRATLKTFVLDRLKGWSLAALLMVGFLTIVLNLLERFGLQICPVAWIITATESLLLVCSGVPLSFSTRTVRRVRSHASFLLCWVRTLFSAGATARDHLRGGAELFESPSRI